MFAAVLDNLKQKGGGIHGYAALGEAARAAAKQAPERAVAYYLIATAAENFVETYERLPLSTQALVESSKDITRHIAEIEAAYQAGESAGVLHALNAMSKSLLDKG